MLWKILAVLGLVAVAAGVVVQHALTSTQTRTIADVRSSNVVGVVALRGAIVFARDNRFVLDDGTGRAELATCPVWYKRIRLHEGDEVTAVGQMMSNPSYSMKCDLVLSVYEVFRGSEVIQVRGGPGKPPWTSHRPSEVPRAGTLWP